MSRNRDRDHYVPKHPTPVRGLATVEDWREEPTGVGTDAQVFRAVKKLGEELEANKVEAAKAHGALKKEVSERIDGVEKRLTKQDLVLERMAGQMDVLVPLTRAKSPSAENKAIDERIQKHATTEKAKFRRDLILKLVGGAVALVTSGAFLGWWLS